jgi:hypothetical protein
MTSRTGPASLKDIAGNWVLHHDNAPADTVLSIKEYLGKKDIPMFPHPPYSPHLVPCDHFETVENIQKIVTNELRTHKKLLPVLL